MVRNPSWDPGTDALRPAYPDRIELTIGGGSSGELARLVETAEVDLVLDSSPSEQVARYRADPALEDRVFAYANDIGFAISMNIAVPPFARRARPPCGEHGDR